MRHLRSALAGLLGASALMIVTVPATAQVNVDVTLGYPGGYGIAQPSYYNPPQPVYVQPSPVYVQRDWNNGRSQWRERQEQHEREWRYREHHENRGRYDNDGWHHSQNEHEDRGWRDGSDRHDWRGGSQRDHGWQR